MITITVIYYDGIVSVIDGENLDDKPWITMKSKDDKPINVNYFAFRFRELGDEVEFLD